MKGFRASTLSISQSSDIVDPDTGRPVVQTNELSGLLPPKSVKFFDENTLERLQRHQDIGNGIVLSESGSKSPESDMTTSLPDSVKEAGSAAAAGGATNNLPLLVRSDSGRYHYMGPESNGLPHHSSVPTINIGNYGTTFSCNNS